MNRQKYLSFVKTVEYGSFTKAAEMLNYTQSGISRMIADLEKEWNVTLLERRKTGVKLTSDGMKLLPYVKNVCEEYGRLQAEVGELNGLQSGLIRIGTFSSVATHRLPNIIKAFQHDYPNIDYELLLGDYAVMSMVESGLGNAILPQLILKRVPYNILAKELDVPAYRDIGLVLKSRKNASTAVKKFIKYLRYR